MLSSSGFRDALGERDLRFDRESGQVRERLMLRPELAAYHRALQQRVSRLSSIADPRLAPVEDVEHDPLTGRVTVISQQVSGLRLQQILRSAREHEMVPDLTIALFFTAEVLAAAHVLHAASGLPHGSIAPDRVIVTPAGEAVLADYAFGEAIEAARFTPRRLWHEFGISQWLGEPFTIAGDVRQAALVAVAVMLGRPLDAVAMPDGLDALLIEVEEAAMIRGGRLFAEPVVAWLTRALGTNTFETADEAAQACAALLTDRERAVARSGLKDFLEELDRVPVSPPARPAPLPAPESRAAFAPPVEPSSSSVHPEPTWVTAPGPEWATAPESVVEPEPPLSFHEPTPRHEPVREAEWEPDPERDSDAEREPEPEPVAATEFEAEPIVEPEPAVIQEPVAVNGPLFSAPSESPMPAGGLTTSWPPPPTPAFEVGPDSGPRVVSPSPLSLVQGVGRSKPIAPETPPAVVAPPPIPPPVARPIEPVPLPPIIEPASVVTPSAEVDAPETAAPIRLKSPTGIRLKDTTKRSSPPVGLDLSDRPAPEPVAGGEDEQVSPRVKIPWKYIAVAAVLLATGFAVTTVDWRSSARPDTKKATPITKPPAPAAPPATTGALQVLSNTEGSKVLIDGRVRGETPLTIDDLEPGRHVVIVRAPNGNVRRTITIAAGKLTKLDLTVYSGWVVVSAPIELQIFDGDKAIGNAGEGPIVLTAGPHEIVVVNEALGYRSLHSVDVQPGEEERITVDPKGSANLNAVPWAEVWLDGNRLGETPLGNIQVPLGIREFVFRHPEHGERRVTATITASETAQITVDFTR